MALADLKLQVSDPSGPVAVGEQAVYEIRVQNRGASTANEVNVVALFSEGIEPDQVEGAMYTVADGRVTRVGRLLRRTRLDELPQFWNVLAGDMSFVGPRPERPEFVATLQREIPFYKGRHSVRPGITGWAQVRHRYAASIEDSMEKLQYDLYYIKNLSPLLDLVILLSTLQVVLFTRGSR